MTSVETCTLSTIHFLLLQHVSKVDGFADPQFTLNAIISLMEKYTGDKINIKL